MFRRPFSHTSLLLRLFLLPVGILITFLSARASSPLDVYPELMDTLVAGRFNAGDSMCVELESRFPGHPGVMYAQASVVYARMVDLEDSAGRGRFMELIENCTRACKIYKKKPYANRAEIAFLNGSALAARGLILSREGQLLPGLRSLMTAKSEFDEAIDSNPTFYDAYLGRGAYRYGVAKHSGMLRWLPIIPSASSGWKDMWLAVEKSRFSRWSALTSLVWFALDDNNYALADSICRAGLERFPNNRNFLGSRLSLEVRQHRFADAQKTAQVLLDHYLAIPNNGGSETVNLCHELMQISDSLAQPEVAVRYAQKGLGVHCNAFARKRNKDHLAAMAERVKLGPRTVP
jgi:hypothetical protein